MIGYSIRAERKKKKLTDTVEDWCRDIDWLIREYGISLNEDYFEPLLDALILKCDIRDSDPDDVHHLLGHLVYDVLDEKIQDELTKRLFDDTLIYENHR